MRDILGNETMSCGLLTAQPTRKSTKIRSRGRISIRKACDEPASTFLG